MNKKAISPVIATVLLIVVAIALFLLIFLWLSGFQKESISKYGTPVETVCTNLRYEASYNAGILQVTNTGSTTIYKVNVYVDGRLKTDKPIPQLTPAASGQVNNLGCASGKKIKVIPYLLGTTQKGENREYACEQQAKTLTC